MSGNSFFSDFSEEGLVGAQKAAENESQLLHNKHRTLTELSKKIKDGVSSLEELGPTIESAAYKFGISAEMFEQELKEYSQEMDAT